MYTSWSKNHEMYNEFHIKLSYIENTFYLFLEVQQHPTTISCTDSCRPIHKYHNSPRDHSSIHHQDIIFGKDLMDLLNPCLGGIFQSIPLHFLRG